MSPVGAALQPADGMPGVFPLADVIGAHTEIGVLPPTPLPPPENPMVPRMNGQTQVTSVRFENQRRYGMVAPEFGGIFRNDDPMPWADLNTATITARTVVQGDVYRNALDLHAIQEYVERATVQSIQNQYNIIYANATGLPNNYTTAATVRNELTYAANAITQTLNGMRIVDANTWALPYDNTGTTNAITIPNGIRVINMRHDMNVDGQLTVTVEATVDNVYFSQLHAQTEEQRQTYFIEQLRRKMKNAVILVKKAPSIRKTLTADEKAAANERKARETLREMITESEYRRYVTNGFVMVKAKSGLWYQIFNKEVGYNVRTYKDGKPFESLCIHTDASCPPTDHVINMKVLAEIDEEALRKGANISKIGDSFNTLVDTAVAEAVKKAAPQEGERLIDLYKRLKPKKAA